MLKVFGLFNLFICCTTFTPHKPIVRENINDQKLFAKNINNNRKQCITPKPEKNIKIDKNKT